MALPVGWTRSLPFVVEPADRGSFEDGFHVGQIDGLLATGVHGAVTMVTEERLLHQLDLVAMRHGYSLTRLAAEPGYDGSLPVHFTRDLAVEATPCSSRTAVGPEGWATG